MDIPRRITLERVEKFRDSLRQHFYHSELPLHSIHVYTVPISPSHTHLSDHSHTEVEFSQIKQVFDDGKGKSVSVGDIFGPTWSTHWFKVVGEAANDDAFLLFNANSEAAVYYDENGDVLQGLTGPEPFQRHEMRLKRGNFVLFIESSCNGLFGAGKDDIIAPPDHKMVFKLEKACVGIANMDIISLYHDLDVLIGLSTHFGDEYALFVANEAVNNAFIGNNQSIRDSIKISGGYFKLNHGSNALKRHSIFALGNCHIDTAWLWPYAETVRKCSRSWSTVLALMDEYDKCHFAISQAQQLDAVRQRYPKLFEKLRNHDRIHVVGGTWVEPDTNIPCSESLIRQFLVGQRFFKKFFGSECSEFWLPDTFGYSAVLPQIMKKCGVSTFISQKMSWNLFNKLPHQFFQWQGIDGSRVLCHFPPTDTYCSHVGLDEVKRHVDQFTDRHLSRTSLLLYGVGDGGGGPTRAHLERLNRLSDVDGLPQLIHGTLDDVLCGMRPPGYLSAEWPIWVGELYLEMHRGTFTTQSKTKQMNRQCEMLLKCAEMWSSAAMCEGMSDRFDFEALWKSVLINSFHDVLPGSSIQQVYVDAAELYQEVIDKCRDIIAQSQSFIARGCGRMIFNSLSFPRTEVIDDVSVTVPGLGWFSFDDCVNVDGDGCSVKQNGDVTVLSNKYLIAHINSNGHITSLIHRSSGREACRSNEHMVELVMYDDNPLYWDAWDIEAYHTQKVVARDFEAVFAGVDQSACHVQVEHVITLSDVSEMRQAILLDSESPYITIKCECDWHESHKLLKVHFPINVHSSEATYEIQSGLIRRPTHANTSWDAAKFEVVAQKWADVSESGFGVSILNDCKYGHSANGTTLSLSLLRSPKKPDDDCDMGKHVFSFAVMPHGTTLTDTIQAAAAFNEPLSVAGDGGSAVSHLFCTVVQPSNVIIQCIKQAEDDANALIIRCYESVGSTEKVSLLCSMNLSDVHVCDMLERSSDDQGDLTWGSGSISYTLGPFEIVSFFVRR